MKRRFVFVPQTKLNTQEMRTMLAQLREWADSGREFLLLDRPMDIIALDGEMDGIKLDDFELANLGIVWAKEEEE